MSENINNSRVLYFQKNINSKEFVFAIVKKWYLIVASVVAAFLIALIYTASFVTPLYASTAKIIIFNKTETSTINDLELSASLYLTKDFKEIITDKAVLGEVSTMLMDKYSIPKLKRSISINNPQNTRIIEITALTPNPEDSKKIVDAVCDVSQEKLVELMGLDRISLISNGDAVRSPSVPIVGKNLLLGSLIGLLIGMIIVYISYIIDNKITSSEDVEKIFGISVLATIPYNNKQKTKK